VVLKSLYSWCRKALEHDTQDDHVCIFQPAPESLRCSKLVRHQVHETLRMHYSMRGALIYLTVVVYFLVSLHLSKKNRRLHEQVGDRRSLFLEVVHGTVWGGRTISFTVQTTTVGGSICFLADIISQGLTDTTKKIHLLLLQP
jgi:hypothetical protein